MDIIVGHQLLVEVPPCCVKRETRDGVGGTAKGERGELNEVSVARHGVELKIRRIYRPCMTSPVFKPHAQSDAHLGKTLCEVL